MQRSSTPVSPSMGWQLLILLSSLIFFGLWSVCLGQDLNWDLLQYHFYNGFAFLHHRFHQDVAPAMMQTYINPYFDVINYFLISLQKPKLTEFFLGTFSGLSFFFLYKISELLFINFSTLKRSAALFFSLLISSTGSMGVSLLNTTSNDTKMSTLVMIALFCVLKSLTVERSHKIILMMVAMFLMGINVGLKLTAACYWVGLFAVILFSKPLIQKHIFFCLIFLLSALLGFLLINGYWMFQLYIKFHNPLFPYYNNIFHSPYAPLISFNFAPRLVHLTFSQFLFLPFYLMFQNNLSSEISFCDSRLACLFLLSTALFIKYLFPKYFHNNNTEFVVFISERSKSVWRALFIFFGVSYLMWWIGFTTYRYFLPLEMLMGFLFVFLVFSLFKSFRSQILFLTLLFLLFQSTTFYPNWGSRFKYQTTFFSMSAPSVSEEAIILLTSIPLSYIVPFFPKSNHFFGMPFITLGVNEISDAEIKKRKLLVETFEKLRATNQPIFTLSYAEPNNSNLKIKKILAWYGFQKEDHCQFLKTNVGDRLKLCRLR